MPLFDTMGDRVAQARAALIKVWTEEEVEKFLEKSMQLAILRIMDEMTRPFSKEEQEVFNKHFSNLQMNVEDPAYVAVMAKYGITEEKMQALFEEKFLEILKSIVQK